MTLGERKRNGPRVLVNRLNINQDVIERLRRITKVCGKPIAPDKAKNQSTEASKVNEVMGTGDKREIVNGSCNSDDKNKRITEENGIKEAGDKDSKESKLRHS